MSFINNVIAKEKLITVEYTEIPEWKITLAYVPREEMSKIRNQCIHIKFNKAKRDREEVIDTDKFLELYTKQLIRGWTGLKAKNLYKLLPIDESKVGNLDAEVPYTEEDAAHLMLNSPDFDRFVTDVVNDVARFNNVKQEQDAKNLKLS